MLFFTERLGGVSMRSWLLVSLIGAALLLHVAVAQAQQPILSASALPQGVAPHPTDDELNRLRRDVAELRAQLAAIRKGDDENKQVELLQKQIEEQRKFIQMLVKLTGGEPPACVPGKLSPTQGVTQAAHQEPAPTASKPTPGVPLPSDFARTAQATTPQDDKQKRQLELLQKQIEDQQKMIELLLEQVKKQPLAGPAVEKLQTNVATLEGRSRQAAQRDQELAQAVDNLSEHVDALERNGPRLAATLKELFFPSQTNETPLSIYTNLVVGYNSPETGTAGPFFGNFSPHLRLVLNEWIYAIGEVDVFSNGAVDVSDAEVDFIVNDWLTVVIGRFPAPIGFFNERLNSPWINKLPDVPLMYRQVSPPFSVNGIEARGAHYVCGLPVKIAYAAYASSGLELNNQTPGINDVANLENMQNTYNVVSSEPTFGGRLSLWYPEIGVEVGISGLTNADYTPVAEDGIKLWEFDANYHKGNWDLRFEYAELYQQAASFIGTNIRRRGLYAQVAYRPLDAPNSYLQKLELVGRYGYTSFSGIDPTAIDPTTFATPVDVPVNRNQYTIGINYWFYASLVAQVAYEFNQEPGFPLHDNLFMAQLGWGF
jgi:hypothetical protein